MIDLTLINAAVLFVTLTPVFAYVFFQFDYTGLKWYALLWFGTIAVSFGAFFVPTLGGRPRLTNYFWLYGVFILAAIPVHGVMRGFERPWKLFALSLLLAFFAANFWELPVYVYGFFGIEPYSRWFNWFYQIHNLYMVATFWLYMKLARVRLTPMGVFMLASGLFYSAVVLYIQTPFSTLLARLMVLIFMIGVIIGGFKNG